MTRFAWLTLAYNVFVVLWGALVRATGSGAGCGEHWPLCNGAVVPVFPQAHTAIEYTHRITSGIGFLLVAGLYVWFRRRMAQGEPARRAAGFALFFMVNEALIGALLVKLGLVAASQSPWRPLVLTFHLVNTLLLLGALTLAGWWSYRPPPRPSLYRRLLAWGIALAMLTSAAGGIAALGDTLFPAASLAEGMTHEFSRSAPLLVRLRLLHPLLAVFTGSYLVWLSLRCQAQLRDTAVRRWGSAMVWLILAQFALGGLNILLLTPVWTQLAHLFLTDLLWISLVLFAASVLAIPAAGRDLSRISSSARGSGASVAS